MLRIRFLVAGAIAGLALASPASAHPSGASAAPLAPVACTGCWVPALQSRFSRLPCPAGIDAAGVCLDLAGTATEQSP